jgi:class 3 adenylate cyclase/TolB-like protein
VSEAFDLPAVSERRLAAVLCLDVAGYSSLMEVDEEGTLARLQSIQQLIERAVARGHGRVFGVAGDGFMAEFTSPVAAVRAAIIIQQEVQAANQGLAPMQQMRLRIGAHLGDVMVSGDRLYGDGVNIAARLQAVAEPGGLCASAAIVEHVRGKVGVDFRDIGERVLRNLQTPVRAYTVRIGADASPRPHPGQRRLKTAMVSLLGIFIAGASIYSQMDDPSTILPFRAPAPAARTPDMPSLVVMPFAGSMAADEDMLLADGITEDLSTDLGKFRTLLVFATDALDLPDGTSQGLADAMRTLKPRYIVEGAVQSLHEQLRINVRLVDGRDGRQIWADRWNRPKEDLFTLQDEITQAVAMALPLELRVAELERIKTRRASNLDSYELWLRARQSFDDPTPDSNLAARRMLE